jgi:hypothetical protein
VLGRRVKTRQSRESVPSGKAYEDLAGRMNPFVTYHKVNNFMKRI